MKVIFFGTPYFVVPVLDALTKHYDVVAVVTAPDKKVGRKLILTPSPVKQYALDHNIEVLTPEKLSDINSQLSTLNSQLFVVAAYGKIIPQDILELPKYGAVNIHPSALPEYRGPSPITQTILNGDKTSAISFMKMDEKMDHGPILKAVPYAIPEDATTESLTPQMFEKSAELLPEIIDDYVAGKLSPVEQNHDEATYTKIITKQDGYIDLNAPQSPEELDRKIRAYYPWPTVWSTVRIKNQSIRQAQDKEVRIKFLPNVSSLREANKMSDEAISSKCLIQMEGKNPVTIKDFLNGYPELKNKLEKIIS